MVPLRVLSRTNLAYSSHRSTPNPCPFNSLPPLEFSWLSFCDSRSLFSAVYSLFAQKTGGGYTPPGAALWNQQLTVFPFVASLLAALSSFAQAANSFIYRFYAESLANPFIYRFYANTPGGVGYRCANSALSAFSLPCRFIGLVFITLPPPSSNRPRRRTAPLSAIYCLPSVRRQPQPLPRSP